MIKNRHLRILVTGAVFALIFYAGDQYKNYRIDQVKYDAYKRVIPLIGINETSDFETAVDKIRLFLFENTEYNDGEAFRKIWGNHTAVANSLIASADGSSAQKTPLECSSRSGAMENILITLGYKVRSVDVYAYTEDYDSHTFLEVQDPKTGAWHIQDVQFNIYWRLKQSGARASVDDLIKLDNSEYEPCRTPDNCGWNLPNREGSYAKNLIPYFGLASINDYQRHKRPLLVNTSRFDLDTPQQVGEESLTYCAFRPKNCREDIIKYENLQKENH